jgi:Cu-Zn family superoxide dismutase
MLLWLAMVPEPVGAQMARAEMRDASGDVIGTATLLDDPRGVRIVLKLSKLPPGTHGFHIHAVGQCEPPKFASAGGHFNPGIRKHGLENPQGHHAGDLANLVVGADGSVNAEVIAGDVTLGAPVDAYSLFPPTGTALVIHANPDDGKTDPAGSAGDRIACGVITR